jgi:hypothetical protein
MHIAPELLHKRWTHHPARKLFLYLLRTDTGLASGEIARRYGISAVAMSSLYSRFSRMVADDRSLQKTIATIRKRYGKL